MQIIVEFLTFVLFAGVFGYGDGILLWTYSSNNGSGWYFRNIVLNTEQSYCQPGSLPVSGDILISLVLETSYDARKRHSICVTFALKGVLL